MADEHTPPPAMPAYPARLEIDYPEEGLDPVSTAFRLVLVLPIGVIAALLTTNALDWTGEDADVGWRSGPPRSPPAASCSCPRSS